MGVSRAEDGGLEHAGDPHVGDEAARARGEPVTAQPMVRFADHRTMRSACPRPRTPPTNLFIS